MSPLVIGGPAGQNSHTWTEPVWSSDGRRLAITARAQDLTLLLDLSRSEYFVMRGANLGKRWAPTPELFAGMPSSQRRP